MAHNPIGSVCNPFNAARMVESQQNKENYNAMNIYRIDYNTNLHYIILHLHNVSNRVAINIVIQILLNNQNSTQL